MADPRGQPLRCVHSRPTSASLFDDAHTWARKELDVYAKWPNGPYSKLDLNDGLVPGSREHDGMVGLYGYFENLKVVAPHVWAHANHSPANLVVAPVDPRVFEVRARILWGLEGAKP